MKILAHVASLVVLCFVFLLGEWTEPAAAHARDVFDPNLLTYEPEDTALPECRISMGLDPSWTFKASTKEKDGNTEYRYDFDTDRGAEQRPFDAFLFNPQIHARFSCKDSIDKEGVRRTGERLQKFAGRVAKNLQSAHMDKGTYQNVSAVQKVDIPGLDAAYLIAGVIPPKEETEFERQGVVLWLIGTKEDRYIYGFLQLIDPVGGLKTFEKGQEAAGLQNGKTLKVELANSATLVDKVFYGSRSLHDDRAYLLSVVHSIR